MSGFDLDRLHFVSRVGPGHYVLAGMLSVVLLVRLLPLFGVYRGDGVVLSGNDPYYYRYLVLALHEAGNGLVSLPPFVVEGEPLLVVTLWAASMAAGGKSAVDPVLAWYPVAAALVTGILVYRIGVAVTGDRRVGLAAVGFLAVTPGHAIRTGLGFADHHAFDYVWLALTMYALVAVLVSERDRRWSRWMPGVVLGLGVAGQSLAWEASPLLLVPLAVAVPIAALFVVRDGTHWRLGSLTAGLGLATGIVLLAHTQLGWHRPAVAAVPGLLFVGSLGTWLTTAGVARAERSTPTLGVAEFLGGVVGVVAIIELDFYIVAALRRGLDRLFVISDIGEMKSIVSGPGPMTGPLILLAFAPLFAMPTMVWAVWHAIRDRRPEWIVLVVYAAAFTGITVVQRRFAGQAAITLAVFAGFGFVWFLAWFELVGAPRPGDDFITDDQHASQREESRQTGPAADELPLPGRRQFVGIAVFSLAYGAPGVLYTGLIDRDLTIDRSAYRAARWMQAYADDRGWDYPDNYVFSHWGRNRMFNAVVNGESQTYGFAQRHYEDFLFSNRPREWYESLRDRVGFVVTRPLDEERTDGGLVVSMDMHRRLHLEWGTETESASGLAHYRAVYASEDGTVKVFTLVPGATLAGATTADEIVVSTSVRIEGASFTYRQRTAVEDDQFSITVPYPGTYSVRAGAQERQITVTEDDVQTGVRRSLR